EHRSRRPEVDLRGVRLHLRPRGRRPGRRHPTRDGVRRHPRLLDLSRVRRAQAGLRRLRGL
ncbi:MAG: Rubredoxin, partial [uncultured Solirubrobacteraceae bacterium]